jgi:hypothetical protein
MLNRQNGATSNNFTSIAMMFQDEIMSRAGIKSDNEPMHLVTPELNTGVALYHHRNRRKIRNDCRLYSQQQLQMKFCQLT